MREKRADHVGILGVCWLHGELALSYTVLAGKASFYTPEIPSDDSQESLDIWHKRRGFRYLGRVCGCLPMY